METVSPIESGPEPQGGSWFEPLWPAPPNVRALCTTRLGGVSAAPWDSLNLGNHVGDAPAAVAANRARVQAEVGARGGGELLFLNQVHGCEVLDADACLSPPQGESADGCTAGRARVALAMMVADCLPVLMCDRAGRRVGAFHAGWRGLAGQGGHGVLEAGVAAFVAAGHAPAELLVWLGPCIGPEAFEVGEEVRQAFVEASPVAAALFRPRPAAGQWLADLPGLARLRLGALGVSTVYGNDGTRAWCTHSRSALFFSHRRDSRLLGASGRFAACIWRV